MTLSTTSVVLADGGNGTCHNCGADINTMCFKGEFWCSDLCRKVLTGSDT